MSEAPRYFTLSERLAQPPVSSVEPMPSPSMYDELLRPLWWTPSGLSVDAPVTIRRVHGSEAGYHQHRSADEDPCNMCLAGHARYNRANRQSHLDSHGTLAGFQRHALRGDLICDLCLNLACELEQQRTRRYYAERLAA